MNLPVGGAPSPDQEPSRDGKGRMAGLSAAFVLTCATGAVLLGLVVLAGWHFRIPPLVQIHHSLAPMQYNTALCFVLSGAALAAAARFRLRLALPVSAVLFLIGFLTALQYAFSINLGIDQLLFDHYILTHTSHPGRMSPMSAVVFTFSGLALLLGCSDRGPAAPSGLTGLLASLVLALGAVAVFGYGTGLSGAYGWGEFSQMSLHTAAGSMLTGAGILVFAIQRELSVTKRSPRWLAIAAGIAVLSGSLVLANALLVNDRTYIRRSVVSNAETVAMLVAARMDFRVKGLARMARRWSLSGQPPRGAWEDDALAQLEDFPGYKSISWVDPDGRVIWTVPSRSQTAGVGSRVDAGESQASALREARESGRARLSRPVSFGDSEEGVFLTIPLSHQGKFEGFIVGAISFEPVMDFILPPQLARGYSVSLMEGGRDVYTRFSPDPPAQEYGVAIPVPLYGADWTVAVEPERTTLETLTSPYPLAVLLCGAIFSALLTLSIHFARKASARSQEADETNLELVEEIRERKSAEQKLHDLGMLHRTILSHASTSVISTTPEGLITSFNPAAERMLGYSADEMVGKHTPAIIHKPEEVIQRASSLSRELGRKIEPGFETLVAKSIESDVEQREWTYIRKDRSQVPVTLGVTPIRDEEGAITGFLGIASDISDLKKALADLADTHSKLLDLSHRAGMAEVATSVLHNVGNVLNSVNISSSVVAGLVRNSKIAAVGKTAELLQRHGADLAGFVTTDPTGRKIPLYLESLYKRLAAEQEEILAELVLLGKNIDHIKDVISMQQGYAVVSGAEEEVEVSDLIEDSLRMNTGSLNRHSIEIVKDYGENPRIRVQKHKALQILVNLISNAKHACARSGREEREVTIRVTGDETRVRIHVSDNGEGIDPDNLTRIFAHGFTTKEDGHGFGLHSSALAATDMGGRLTASSPGSGQGACFTLELPHPP